MSLRRATIFPSEPNRPCLVFPFWLPALLLLVSSFTHSNAAELHFNNGDRISGEVVRRVDGKIHFLSPLLGNLVIAETEAVIIETPDTPTESLAGLPPVIEQVRLRDADVPRPQQRPAPPPKWKGKLEFGFNNHSGRIEAKSLNLRGETTYVKKANNYRVNARYLYGETNGLITSDRRDASFRWRRELSGKVFAQTATSYFSDRVARVDANLEQNAGFGYKFLTQDRSTASVGGGLTLQYRDAAGVENGATVLGEFFQDYSYKINGRLTFSQDLNALYSPDPRTRTVIAGTSALSEEADNYKIRFNSTLQGKLSERISLNLRYEYEYDNAILLKDNRSDQRVSSSLGYSF
jgi:putative salt-induced outer membrane protein YdiY